MTHCRGNLLCCGRNGTCEVDGFAGEFCSVFIWRKIVKLQRPHRFTPSALSPFLSACSIALIMMSCSADNLQGFFFFFFQIYTFEKLRIQTLLSFCSADQSVHVWHWDNCIPKGNAITAVALMNCAEPECLCKMFVTVKYIWCQKASNAACGYKNVKSQVPKKKDNRLPHLCFFCW